MIKKNFIIMCLILILAFSTCTCFASSNVKIAISDDEILVSGEAISNDSTSPVYLSKNMDNGGTSDEAVSANKTVENVINIKASGTYEITGKLTDGQIAIDTNSINGDVVILLNNASITCINAPAIFVYNVATQSETCNVIIKTEKDSVNYVYGGLIKQSVEGWQDQDKIVYSVEKSYNDEGQYFERYKYDGAISSDISLTFEGEGTLEIESEREGIEGKRDITFNSGTWLINSTEDGINAAQDNESIITINGGTIVVNTAKDGPQGDGIDSNGYLYINGGEVYSFANPTSEDSGLDSDLGIYINGGKVVATGNMYDSIKEDSKLKSVTYQFLNKIPANTLITLVDKNEKAVVAFETDREYKVITFADENLEDKEYIIYQGGKIEGTSVNGLYSNITSYEKGEKIDAQKLSQNNGRRPFDKDYNGEMKNEVDYKVAIIASVVGVVCLVIAIVLCANKKSGFIILIFGILVGVSAMVAINSFNVKTQMPDRSFEKMPEMRNIDDFGGRDKTAKF